MSKKNNTCFFFAALLALVLVANSWSGCVVPHRYEGIAPGIWRATLLLDGRKSAKAKTKKEEMIKRDEQVVYEEVTEGELPFLFEVKPTDDGRFTIEILNGKERVIVQPEDIQFGKVPNKAIDTIRINFPLYESYITARYEADIIEGYWVVKTRQNYRIPFVAKYGKTHRFTALRKEPALDVSGLWAVAFQQGDTASYPAVGEFEQNGNFLTGTFRTETGDYRYLEGTVQANKLYLSAFDGSHAFLFEAVLNPQTNTLFGVFRSGTHLKTTWEAKRDPNFDLRDPDSLTFLKPGFDRFDFSFPNLAAKTVTPNDPAFQGKVKVIQIMGTWCPNCADETRFLTDFYKNFSQKDQLALIALAYEKHEDFASSQELLQKWKARFDVPYDVLVTGVLPRNADASLPMLNHVMSFPTMIVLDKNNRVRKIHTGFDGPATSRYQDFTAKFEATIKALVQE